MIEKLMLSLAILVALKYFMSSGSWWLIKSTTNTIVLNPVLINCPWKKAGLHQSHSLPSIPLHPFSYFWIMSVKLLIKHSFYTYLIFIYYSTTTREKYESLSLWNHNIISIMYSICQMILHSLCTYKVIHFISKHLQCKQ